MADVSKLFVGHHNNLPDEFPRINFSEAPPQEALNRAKSVEGPQNGQNHEMAQPNAREQATDEKQMKNPLAAAAQRLADQKAKENNQKHKSLLSSQEKEVDRDQKYAGDADQLAGYLTKCFSQIYDPVSYSVKIIDQNATDRDLVLMELKAGLSTHSSLPEKEGIWEWLVANNEGDGSTESANAILEQYFCSLSGFYDYMRTHAQISHELTPSGRVIITLHTPREWDEAHRLRKEGRDLLQEFFKAILDWRARRGPKRITSPMPLTAPLPEIFCISTGPASQSLRRGAAGGRSFWEEDCDIAALRTKPIAGSKSEMFAICRPKAAPPLVNYFEPEGKIIVSEYLQNAWKIVEGLGPDEADWFDLIVAKFLDGWQQRDRDKPGTWVTVHISDLKRARARDKSKGFQNSAEREQHHAALRRLLMGGGRCAPSAFVQRGGSMQKCFLTKGKPLRDSQSLSSPNVYRVGTDFDKPFAQSRKAAYLGL